MRDTAPKTATGKVIRPWEAAFVQGNKAWARNRNAVRALAPEMAEAILAVSDADLSVYDDVPEAHDLMSLLDAVAEKLRQIGVSDGNA